MACSQIDEHNPDLNDDRVHAMVRGNMQALDPAVWHRSHGCLRQSEMPGHQAGTRARPRAETQLTAVCMACSQTDEHNPDPNDDRVHAMVRGNMQALDPAV